MVNLCFMVSLYYERRQDGRRAKQQCHPWSLRPLTHGAHAPWQYVLCAPLLALGQEPRGRLASAHRRPRPGALATGACRHADGRPAMAWAGVGWRTGVAEPALRPLRALFQTVAAAGAYLSLLLHTCRPARHPGSPRERRTGGV